MEEDESPDATGAGLLGAQEVVRGASRIENAIGASLLPVFGDRLPPWSIELFRFVVYTGFAFPPATCPLQSGQRVMRKNGQ